MSNSISPPPSSSPPPPPPPHRSKPPLHRTLLTTHLSHLLRTLDILIYCELSILYYMDCSLPHFLLRALPHWFYLTPKPPLAPFPPAAAAAPRPSVAVLAASNAIVLLAHLFSAQPAAGEATRGYLHGGLLIDFVGEWGPVARWRLVGLDVLVLGLQWVALGVVGERAGVEAGRERGQDADAEERGVVVRAEGGEGIEGRGLGSGGDGGGGGGDEWLEGRAVMGSGEAGDHPLDAFHTGEYVIADLHIFETLRRQWAQYGSVAAEGSGTSTPGSQTAMAPAGGGRRFGFRLRVGDRVFGGGPS